MANRLNLTAMEKAVLIRLAQRRSSQGMKVNPVSLFSGQYKKVVNKYLKAEKALDKAARNFEKATETYLAAVELAEASTATVMDSMQASNVSENEIVEYLEEAIEYKPSDFLDELNSIRTAVSDAVDAVDFSDSYLGEYDEDKE